MRSMYRDYVHQEEPRPAVVVSERSARNTAKSTRDVVFAEFLKSQPASVQERLKFLARGVSGRHMKRIMGRLAALERMSSGDAKR